MSTFSSDQRPSCSASRTALTLCLFLYQRVLLPVAQRNSQAEHLAFAMGQHQRLGDESHVLLLDEPLVCFILQVRSLDSRPMLHVFYEDCEVCGDDACGIVRTAGRAHELCKSHGDAGPEFWILAFSRDLLHSPRISHCQIPTAV